MRIFGISFGTIILIAVVVFIVRKWGNSIPVVSSVSSS